MKEDARRQNVFDTQEGGSHQRRPLEGEVRIPSGCAIAGLFHKKGQRVGGDVIVRAMEPMHDRSNGLGGGFAGYGIYPDHADAMPSTCFMITKVAGRTVKNI